MNGEVNTWGTLVPTYKFRLVSISALKAKNGQIFVMVGLFVRKLNLYFKIGRLAVGAKLNVLKCQVFETIRIKQRTYNL